MPRSIMFGKDGDEVTFFSNNIIVIKFRLFSQVLIKILKMRFFTFSWIQWTKQLDKLWSRS